MTEASNKSISDELQMPVSMGMIIVAIVLIICWAIYMAQRHDINRLKTDAIILNHAEYNRTTGEWQWITNNPYLQ